MGSTVANKLCTSEDLMVVRHCGVSGVRGIANGNEDGTNWVGDDRENNTISDL
jgi:hypothetical protein